MRGAWRVGGRRGPVARPEREPGAQVAPPRPATGRQRARRRPSTTRWRARSWRCSCRHRRQRSRRPTSASNCAAARRRSPSPGRARRPASAPRGCGSGCGDPHRRGVAGGRAHGHARRRRRLLARVVQVFGAAQVAPRLPVRQRARHAHQAARARRVRRVVRGAALEPGPLRLAARGDRPRRCADAGAVRRPGARACRGSAWSR